MEIFEKYPQLQYKFNELSQTRQNEILSNMLKTDDNYKELIKKRTHASMVIKNIIDELEKANTFFEEYSDTIYEQEIYELNAIYKQGFIDAIIVLEEYHLLK